MPGEIAQPKGLPCRSPKQAAYVEVAQEPCIFFGERGGKRRFLPSNHITGPIRPNYLNAKFPGKEAMVKSLVLAPEIGGARLFHGARQQPAAAIQQLTHGHAQHIPSQALHVARQGVGEDLLEMEHGASKGNQNVGYTDF